MTLETLVDSDVWNASVSELSLQKLCQADIPCASYESNSWITWTLPWNYLSTTLGRAGFFYVLPLLPLYAIRIRYPPFSASDFSTWTLPCFVLLATVALRLASFQVAFEFREERHFVVSFRSGCVKLFRVFVVFLVLKRFGNNLFIRHNLRKWLDTHRSVRNKVEDVTKKRVVVKYSKTCAVCGDISDLMCCGPLKGVFWWSSMEMGAADASSEVDSWISKLFFLQVFSHCDSDFMDCIFWR